MSGEVSKTSVLLKQYPSKNSWNEGSSTIWIRLEQIITPHLITLIVTTPSSLYVFWTKSAILMRNQEVIKSN